MQLLPPSSFRFFNCAYHPVSSEVPTLKKMLFIVNPAAGQRKVSRYLPEIISIFNNSGYELTIYMTTGPGSGTQIARTRAADFDIVVCAGGDGTLNEVITGVLYSGTDTPIGYIPAGSTNDFAASLGLSTNILRAARCIVDGVPIRYDVGKFEDRYFSYVASFGAFTRASYSTPQSVKNALGHIAYLLEGIQELTQLRKIHVRIDSGEEVIQEDDFIFGAVSNSTSIGGLLTLDSEQVDLRDGKLELLLLRSPRNMAELSVMIRALRSRKYEQSSNIIFRSATGMTVHMDPGIPWTLDGEKAEGSGHIRITNLHHAIRLVHIPEETND